LKKLALAIVVVILLVPAIAWAVPKITGADIVDDSLTGADVDESTLNLPAPPNEVGYTSDTCFVRFNFSGPPCVVRAPAGRVAIGGYVSDMAPSTTTNTGAQVNHFDQAYQVGLMTQEGNGDEVTLTVVHVAEE
jgi:hypothetical protein